MRGGEKVYQSIDDIMTITMEIIHKQCPENQRCSDLKGEWFDLNPNLTFKSIFWEVTGKKILVTG